MATDDHDHESVLYQAAFRNANDALFLVEGATGIVLDVNAAACALLGRRRETMVGRSLVHLLPAEHHAVVNEATPGGLRERAEPSQMDVARQGQDDPVRVEAEASVAPGPRRVILLTLRDVAARLAASAARENRQRIDLLEQIAGGTAHELNNALAAITGIADVIGHQLPDDSTIRTDLGALLVAANRGKKVTRELAGYAGLGKYRHERLDLEDLIDAAVNEARAPGIEFRKELRSTGQVEGDADQLAQSFVCLLVNAAEALPHGGVIEIVSEDADPDIRITVRDRGVGMSKATAARAFEPYFTTKAPGTATGMGLPMVEGVVRNHRGTVRMESRWRSGTSVTITLPAALAVPPLPPAQPRAPTSSRTILVVDDDEWVRFSVSRMLVTLGFDVLEAIDGAQGLRQWAQHGADVALVVLDVRMPGMDGEQMLRRLRDAKAEVPVLLSTGLAREQVTQSLFELGRVGFLEKPFQLVQLAAEIQRLGVAVPQPPG